MNYLLAGQEEYLKQGFLEKLKKSLSDKTPDLAPDAETFEGGSSEITRILDALDTLPFISDKRLVVIRDIDKFSSNEKSLILSRIKSGRASNIVVLETSSEQFDEFLKEILKFAKLIKCNKLKEPEMRLWIKKEFAGRGKEISSTLASLIIELSGNDMFSLKNEIDKIATFAANDRVITAGHVEMLLGRTAQKSVFELADLVLGKKTGEALASMERLSIDEKPHQVLNLIAWRFRNEGRKRFTADELEKKLEIILEADLFIKSGKVEPRLALEEALVKLCRTAGRG